MGISEPKGPLPHLVAAEEDVWHDLIIQCNTLDEIDNAGPNEKWNAYICDAEFNGEDVEKLEIPFWAMKSFWEIYEDYDEPTKGTLELRFKRRRKGDLNTAQFKVV